MESPIYGRVVGVGLATEAKKDILKEVVAFANAYGGVLLIGIEDSGTPPVATTISPVPRCADLVGRFRKIFRDRVEPQFIRLEVDYIPIKDKCECKAECRCGVVIIRVGKSRLAPHRDKKTRICSVRRADRSEEMTMREIQDMTLNVTRGLERLEKRLSERSERFEQEFDRLEHHANAFGIRLTAVPVMDEIRYDHVFEQGSIVKDLDIPWRTVVHKRPDDERNLSVPAALLSSPSPLFWRPLLRGARAEPHTPISSERLPALGYGEIHCDGLVEFGLVSTADELPYFLCDPDWPMAMFDNLAVWADQVRKQAGALAVEYALEVETRNPGNAGLVGTKEAYQFRPSTGRTLPRLPNEKFPVYPLNDPNEITELLALFYRDFWNSMGQDNGDANFILG